MDNHGRCGELSLAPHYFREFDKIAGRANAVVRPFLEAIVGAAPLLVVLE
jgi:hypothetical protein